VGTSSSQLNVVHRSKPEYGSANNFVFAADTVRVDRLLA
jgi:hypothetical protein